MIERSLFALYGITLAFYVLVLAITLLSAVKP